MRRSRRRAKSACSSHISAEGGQARGREIGGREAGGRATGGPEIGPGRTLILASRSPQRRAILQQIGVTFTVHATDTEELTSGPPEEVALENAYRKAAAAIADTGGSGPVLGVDTIVALGSRIYGKPTDQETAGVTLRALSGRRHAVLSGLCVIEPGPPERVRTAAARTLVEFRQLSEATVQWYLQTGEWRERAGGYAIQGRGALLVAGIEGDYLNVVGLPVAALADLAPWLVEPG